MAKAIAVLTRLGEPEVGGVISFTQKTEDTPTAIAGEVRGLKPKETFGISVQIFGDLSEGFGSMGGHFNPFGRNHGEPGDEERHVGSLGNITADEKGVAKFEITDKLVKLIGPYSVIGRGFAVHERADDFGKGGTATSLSDGNAGSGIAGGVIGIKRV
mmetsp:Transcript_7406/g.10828  ORF Transcript_7406/g.10828 Transcript_7406/m.10828 type:complete len:158 (-) Transcript_7406:80-553(-)|eukprot:CAMPEP_0195524364 /NCGR_PEP_ID=MMETSP0794_2-20130614/24162_1 /TAXON_ID=515487 /ORGANISM="Stephanopyxis turris, Strain CCMP 815" /LENGTH=157 /DNA_ID=CAMNT_0040654567 /DNA_START=58 /DNA_END=531 /DNA_ORIENTATION=+